jgi:hypothetical protein
MTQYTNEDSWGEFQSAFWMNVRVDGGEIHDSRPEMLQEYCMLSAQQIIEYLTEPHDFAAIISGVVKVHDPNYLIGGGDLILANETTRQSLRDKTGSANPVFKIQPNHPIATLLANLLQNKEGCEFYFKVACILAEAATDEEFAPYLYH